MASSENFVVFLRSKNKIMLENYTEYIGYLASAFVAISFLLKDLRKIRVVNLIGCLLFVGYGFLINSIPIIITNVLISIFQIYYLFFYKTKE